MTPVTEKSRQKIAAACIRLRRAEPRLFYDYSNPENGDQGFYDDRSLKDPPAILPVRTKNGEPQQQQNGRQNSHRFSLYKFILDKRHTKDLLSRLAAHFRDNDLGVRDMTESKRAAPAIGMGLVWRLASPRRPYRLSELLFDRNRLFHLRRKPKF
uniref:Uncharacterized protein n=1 Tax=Romanomermis culicivorax TaxID=13658 RepID=A0A915KWY1_ROMCU